MQVVELVKVMGIMMYIPIVLFLEYKVEVYSMMAVMDHEVYYVEGHCKHKSEVVSWINRTEVYFVNVVSQLAA